MSARQTSPSTDLPGQAAHVGDELPGFERALLVLLAVGGMLVVGYVTMVNSFGHLQEWARLNGESHPRAERFPWSVDGLMLSSSVMLYIDNRLKRPVDKFAIIFLTSGMAMSMLANVANTWHSEIAGYMIRGWAPYAAAATAHMVLLMVTRLFIKTKKVQPAPVEQPKRSRQQTRTQTSPATTVAAAPPKADPAKSEVGSSRPAPPPAATTATTRPSAGKTDPGTNPGRVRAESRGSSDRSENFLKAQAFWIEEVEAGREPPNGKAIAERIKVSEGMGRRYARQVKAATPSARANEPSPPSADEPAAEPEHRGGRVDATEPELSDEPAPAGQPEPADEAEPEPGAVPEQLVAEEAAPESGPGPTDAAELEPAAEPAAA